MTGSDDSTTQKNQTETTAGVESEACSGSIDRDAPAGSRNSLGAKSDCNGRPATDDSVIEAMDEEGPLARPAESGNGGR